MKRLEQIGAEVVAEVASRAVRELLGTPRARGAMRAAGELLGALERAALPAAGPASLPVKRPRSRAAAGCGCDGGRVVGHAAATVDGNPVRAEVVDLPRAGRYHRKK